MTPAGTVLEMARADFLERARRPAFLVTLGAAAGLAYTVHADVWTVLVSRHAPSPGPATTGLLVALVTSTFLSLAAFYLVRGTVDRDIRTGVGPILAATPASRTQYAAAKVASNTAVLGALVLLLAGLAVAIEAARAGGISAAGAWRATTPSLLVTGPGLVAVAGVAVVFDSVPLLRGTAGNVAYFFLWAGTLTFGGFDTGGAWLDVTGANLVFEGLRDALRAAVPGASVEGLTITANPLPGGDAPRFTWTGVEWTADHLARRLWWVAVGVGLSGVAAAGLRLFDPFRDRGGLFAPAGSPERRSQGSETEDIEGPDPAPTPVGAGESPTDFGGASPGAGARRAGAGEARDTCAGRGPRSIEQLPAGADAPAFVGVLRMAAGELRLLLSGRPWWWYGGLAGANVAALLVSAEAVAIPLLAAWLLPLPAWSDLGCRERKHGTEALLFAAPRPRSRQLPAQLVAGTGVSLLAAAVPLCRLAAGGGTAIAVAAVGAVFIPALALALGAWTGKEKTFQAVYLALWYVGPANGIAAMDFMGVTGRAAEAGATPGFAAATLALIALAWPGRGRRTRAAG